MKFAIIGLGFISARHKQSIQAIGGEVVLTCDNDPFKEADFKDWTEMFDSPKFVNVDAVVICTPNYTHTDIAREALNRGKKVLCEKPLSIDTNFDGLDEVKTVLQLRNAPQVLAVKEKVKEGFHMAHVRAAMYRDDKYWNSWKGDDEKSGGILRNLGIHYIDLLVYLLGDTKRIVHTTITKTHAHGLVEFERGVASFTIEIVDDRRHQDRMIIVDGEHIKLSDKDNLSYENLHTEVYKQFINDGGVPLGEARKSLQLVADLNAANGK